MKKEELFIGELPNFLSNEEVILLMQEMRKGSKEAKEKLIIHNIRLVIYEVYKFNFGTYDKKDLVSVGIIGLINAINHFDISKNYRFSTYAVKCIDHEIMRFLKKEQKNSFNYSLDAIIFQDDDGNKYNLNDTVSDNIDITLHCEKEELEKIIRDIVNKLPDPKREYVKLYFGFHNNETYTTAEIANKFNVSKQYISFTINNIVKKISRILQIKGLIELRDSDSSLKLKRLR